jgi:hypothetical protein
MVPVETGSRIGRGAFALIAFTLGGSVMVMASRPYSTVVRAVSGTTISTGMTECQKFWAPGSDRDVNPSDVGQGIETPTGAVLNLYSSKSAITKKLTLTWQVVGAIENTSGTNTRIYGTKLGHRNPANPPEGAGCILFKHKLLKGYAASFHQRGGATSKLDSVLFCPNHLSKTGKPSWSNWWADCNTLILTLGDVTTTLTFQPGIDLVARDKSLRQQLATTFKRKGAVDAIIRSLTAQGAWYPCDGNGCCRAS